MKKLITTCCIAASLILPFAMTPAVHSAPPLERHPEIHEAIHALENAKFHLVHADHDFGGHRDAAINACDDAIAQLKAALEFDRR